MALTFMKHALECVESDPINNINVAGFETPGNRVKRLSEFLLKQVEQSDYQKVANNVVRKMLNVLKLCPIKKGTGRELMWTEMHKILISNTDREDWCLLLQGSSFSSTSQEFRILHHSVLMKIIQSLLSHENKQIDDLSTEIHDIHLTNEEQQIVYYVAGYIVFTLRKKYKKIESGGKNQVASAAVEFLDSLRITGDTSIKAHSFLDFTRKWIDIVNRGGLIKVNDDMFIFVRHVENVVRKVLNIGLLKTYHGEDLRDMIHNELRKHSLVDIYWDTLSRHVGNKKLVKHLKEQVISRWVDIRAKAYVKTYVQIVKRKLNSLAADKKKNSTVELSSKGEPAMRKKLLWNTLYMSGCLI